MISIVRYAILLILGILIGWTAYTMYQYFFDTATPTIIIKGLNNGSWYAGDAICEVLSSKAGDLTVILDGKPLLNNFRLSQANKGHSFCIPTKTLNNGRHHLKALFVDRTMRKNKSEVECGFFVDNVPLQAALIKQEQQKVFQGRTLHVQFQVNKEIAHAFVNVFSHTYECFPESKNSSVYECFIPVACEENPNEYLLTIEVTDKIGSIFILESKFQVIPYPFKKETLRIDPQKVAEVQRMQDEMENVKFEQIIAQLTEQSPREKLWKGTFCTPFDIVRVTCEFGTIRTTQEKGRYMHKALDVINAPKAVVWATQEGVVVLVDSFPMQGKVVVIDHGWGLLSLFFHLEDFANITVGQKIAQGNPIGTMGKTGYASGYHLHWEMRLNNVAIDPMQWTKPIF